SRWRCATASAATRRRWSRSAATRASSATSCACSANRRGWPRPGSWTRSRRAASRGAGGWRNWRASGSWRRWRPPDIPLHAADYRPPWWLRNGHLQTMLGSSPWRRRRGAQALAATGATTEEFLVDGGPGVRLQGLLSTIPGAEPRGLALLLHGRARSADPGHQPPTAAPVRGAVPAARLRHLPPELPRPRRQPPPQPGAVPLQPHRRSGAGGARHRAALLAAGLAWPAAGGGRAFAGRQLRATAGVARAG